MIVLESVEEDAGLLDPPDLLTNWPNRPGRRSPGRVRRGILVLTVVGAGFACVAPAALADVQANVEGYAASQDRCAGDPQASPPAWGRPTDWGSGHKVGG
jgi:hypothetical protein